MDPKLPSRKTSEGRGKWCISSQPACVTLGVPQGSILGPLLFLIYIDNITGVNLFEGSQLVLYADDILLYHPIKNDSDYCALQSDINCIENWASVNSMTLNPAKCKIMRISRTKVSTLVTLMVCTFS